MFFHTFLCPYFFFQCTPLILPYISILFTCWLLQFLHLTVSLFILNYFCLFLLFKFHSNPDSKFSSLLLHCPPVNLLVFALFPAVSLLIPNNDLLCLFIACSFACLIYVPLFADHSFKSVNWFPCFFMHLPLILGAGMPFRRTVPPSSRTRTRRRAMPAMTSQSFSFQETRMKRRMMMVKV